MSQAEEYERKRLNMCLGGRSSSYGYQRANQSRSGSTPMQLSVMSCIACHMLILIVTCFGYEA